MHTAQCAKENGLTVGKPPTFIWQGLSDSNFTESLRLLLASALPTSAQNRQVYFDGVLRAIIQRADGPYLWHEARTL